MISVIFLTQHALFELFYSLKLVGNRQMTIPTFIPATVRNSTYERMGKLTKPCST